MSISSSSLQMAVALQLLKTYYAFDRQVVFSANSTRKAVALTFDDGPHPNDHELLDILDKHGSKATFFLCGKHVAAMPDHALAIHRGGHEIGNHSYSHGWNVTFPFSSARILKEIVDTNHLIHSITQEVPVFFRPPRLIQGRRAATAVEQLGMKSIVGNAFAPDWKARMQNHPASIFKVVKHMVKPGSIIILHSGDAESDDAKNQAYRGGSTQATDMLLSALKQDGYEVGTVSDLLANLV